MKRRSKTGSIVALASVLSVLCCAVHAADGVTTRKNDFAFAVSCVDEDPQEKCLVGEFPPGRRITLLATDAGASCKMTTSVRRDLAWEGSGIIGTGLNGSCALVQERQGLNLLAVLSRAPRDFERLTPRQIVNTDEVLSIARTIRSSGVLVPFVSEHMDTAAKAEAIDEVTPTIHQVLLPGLKVFIASYDDPRVGDPRFLVIGDRAYVLTTPCSYESFHVFRLEGQHYILSGSLCCDCGGTAMQLFLVTPQGPIEVLTDNSFSM